MRSKVEMSNFNSYIPEYHQKLIPKYQDQVQQKVANQFVRRDHQLIHHWSLRNTKYGMTHTVAKFRKKYLNSSFVTFQTNNFSNKFIVTNTDKFVHSSTYIQMLFRYPRTEITEFVPHIRRGCFQRRTKSVDGRVIFKAKICPRSSDLEN